MESQDVEHTLRRHPQRLYAKAVWIAQYFEPQNSERMQEILLVIRLNCENAQIDEIVLLNEKIYDTSVLRHPKIRQINIGRRLTYKTVFDFTKDHFGNDVLILLSNLDITFDANDLDDVKHLDLRDTVLALSRYDVTDIKTRSARFFRYFEDVSCSQDTWIYTSLRREFSDDFDIYLGIPGCDGRLSCLLSDMGISVINPSLTIRTYHYHLTDLRTYDRERLTYENLGVRYLEYGSLKYEKVND